MFAKRFLFVLLLLAGACRLAAQEEPRTIRVRKESDLAKAQFDNTQMRLFVIDRFGNVRENEIVSYRLWVKSKKKTVGFAGVSNALSPEMIAFLNKQKEAVKIFFTEIVALDHGDQRVPLPDVIDVWFPDCHLR
jgi:hypothetical protein